MPATSLRGARIHVESGAGAGTTVHVEQPTFVIGSGEHDDLRLCDATVSREHLCLALTSEGVVARDGGSENGTWLEGSRITEALLESDTTLVLGETRIAVYVGAQPLTVAACQEQRFGDALGVSSSMHHVFTLLERLAPSDVSVFLEGESGVGKKTLARALHQRSPRAGAPFVAVDCGTISPELIDSELYGHERGAFAGAVADREGAFERARGGTLFLDDIGALPVYVQGKLLRTIERNEVRPVGSSSSVRRVDVRVVAASNRRLDDAVREGTLRPDLFYRLAAASLTVPPLRHRPDDIEPLARAFLRAKSGDPFAELPGDIGAVFRGYFWPGNVRELKNVVERYASVGICDANVALDSSGGELSHIPYHEARRAMLERFERAYVPAVLARAGGVVARAAEMAEVGRASFYRMLDRSGVMRRP